MKAYEAVIIIDPQLTQDMLQKTKSTIEKLFDGWVQQSDDMGLQTFHHNMKDKKWRGQGFMISYYVSLHGEQVENIKRELGYMKEVVRFVFFAMSTNQPYFTMKWLEKELKPIVESDDWVVKKKVSFFENKQNENYFVRKAVPLLKKFMTRFWDVKPRKYTGISVKQQKKVRKAILRWRELWIIPYIS